MVIKCMKIEKLNCKMCKEIKFNGKIAKKNDTIYIMIVK